jgi:predicted acetyltransferase
VTWTPRVISPDDLDAIADLAAGAFGGGPVATPERRAKLRALIEVDRTFAAYDGGRPVGTAGLFTFSMSTPGGGLLPLGGVTYAAVMTTHRRRGILSALIDALHDQALERGEPIAGLTASEGGIYRRFGYGVAARFQSLDLDPRRLVEHGDAPVSPAEKGAFRLVTEAEAATVMPDVWAAQVARTPGEIVRTPGWWACEALDAEDDRGGHSARYVVVHEDEAGRPDGFLVYRIGRDAGPGANGFRLHVIDLGAVSDGVAAELIRYTASVDLVSGVSWFSAPPDLPWRWRLADPRAVRVTSDHDHLWLRPLDVAACLAGRRYAIGGGLVVEVVDARRPALGGRFLLDGGPAGAECARTDREADVAVRTPDLGSLLLGGVSWTTLHRAGLVDERAVGAVARADTMFRPDRAPYCGTDF